jgi:hypothetical protein
MGDTPCARGGIADFVEPTTPLGKAPSERGGPENLHRQAPRPPIL